ncbi:MAG: hypothetical protein K2K79_06815 [Paramuribaculum sp.]|nr:hypothetical protein [Paramuribaculum sp.]
MTIRRHDINDDEIRIISPSGIKPKPKSRQRILIYGAIAVILTLGVIITYLALSDKEVSDTTLQIEEIPTVQVEVYREATDTAIIVNEPGYVSVTDTVVNGVGLRILTPEQATPALVIGPEALADTTAVLIVQAADVRGDNGQIAGACVVSGNLVSRGEAKAGFCAIINGEMTIGTADATPMLEQAIESEGYFFRQYPLVVGGQIVENKPKGISLRKALAEIDGRIRVVLSSERLTFHDFSQALVDAGVRNAIYLVGSTAAGTYTDTEGNRYKFGVNNDSPYDQINYLVWK